MTTVESVVNEVVQALVKSREFLGIQLDHARGNISDDYFHKYTNKWLERKENTDLNELKEKITILYSILKQPLDSEILSVAFNYSIYDIDEAIKELSNDL